MAKVTSIEIQISVVKVIDPPWRGDVAKVTGKGATPLPSMEKSPRWVGGGAKQVRGT